MEPVMKILFPHFLIPIDQIFIRIMASLLSLTLVRKLAKKLAMQEYIISTLLLVGGGFRLA